MASRVVPSDGPDITQLLLSWSGGDRGALDRVATIVYDELKPRVEFRQCTWVVHASNRVLRLFPHPRPRPAWGVSFKFVDSVTTHTEFPSMGRPSRYGEKLAETICERIAGGESLRRICEDPRFPNRSTVHEWLCRQLGFSDQYARARELQADHYVDEIIEIADTEPDPQRARVRIDARKWTAAKLRPKKYGSHRVVEHKGDIWHRLQAMSNEELDRLVAADDDELLRLAADCETGR